SIRASSASRRARVFTPTESFPGLAEPRTTIAQDISFDQRRVGTAGSHGCWNTALGDADPSALMVRVQDGDVQGHALGSTEASGQGVAHPAGHHGRLGQIPELGGVRRYD